VTAWISDEVIPDAMHCEAMRRRSGISIGKHEMQNPDSDAGVFV
jgi:hypothetical protein